MGQGPPEAEAHLNMVLKKVGRGGKGKGGEERTEEERKVSTWCTAG